MYCRFVFFGLNMAIHFMASRPNCKEMGLPQHASLSKYIIKASEAIFSVGCGDNVQYIIR